MEDLSSISQVIQDILKSPDAAHEESFTELIQGYLQSIDSNVRHVVLEVLSDVVNEGSSSELDTRRRFIFEQTVLTYLPLLLPIHPDAPELVESLVRICLEVCSPREAVLALNEGCQLLEERAERYDVSEDDEDMEELPEDHVPESDHGVDLGELVDTLILVVNSYTTVFGRMPQIKSTPTLFTVSDAINSSLRVLLPACSAPQASALAVGMRQLIQAANEWVGRSTDIGGEQRVGSLQLAAEGLLASVQRGAKLIHQAILTSLLHMSVTLLVPRTQASMMQTWFLAHYPQYALVHPDPTPSAPTAGSPSPLDALQSTATALGISSAELVALVSRDSSMARISPFASFSALTLTAHLLSSSAPATSDIALPDLDDMLILLSSGLGGSATDAAGTIAWEAITRAPAGEVGFASPLIEVLMPLATSDPDDMNRLAWYKLIQALIEKAPAGLDQIMLLDQLLEPANPYDTLRPQALTILRNLLSSPPSSSSSSTSARYPSSFLLQPALIDNLPLLPWAEHLALPTDEFTNGPNGTFVTEQLNTLWVLYELDKGNATGVRGEEWVGRTRASLRDVRRKIESMRKEGEGGAANGEVDGFMLLRLEGAVERLGGKIGQ